MTVMIDPYSIVDGGRGALEHFRLHKDLEIELSIQKLQAKALGTSIQKVGSALSIINAVIGGSRKVGALMNMIGKIIVVAGDKIPTTERGDYLAKVVLAEAAEERSIMESKSKW